MMSMFAKMSFDLYVLCTAFDSLIVSLKGVSNSLFAPAVSLLQSQVLWAAVSLFQSQKLVEKLSNMSA